MMPRSPSIRFWLLQAGIGVMWVAVWHTGGLLERSDNASLWFPPAALTFAAFLATGPKAVLAILAASIFTTFQSAAVPEDSGIAWRLMLSALAFGAVHSLSYGGGAWLFRRAIGSARLDTPGAVLGFLLVATFSSIVASISGLLSLFATGTVVNPDAELVPWWIGDLVGMVTLSPLFLLTIDGASRILGLPSDGWIENLRLPPADSTSSRFAIKLVAVLSLALAFGALGSIAGLRLPVALIVYALMIPLMWIAHTEGSFRTIITVACVSVAVAVITWRFSGEQAFEYQAAMVAIAATGLFNMTVPALYADNRRLRDLVDFDPLTGAFNRSSFLEKAAEEIERAKRYGGAVSVVVIDLDRFKAINDTLGHAAGDRVLARFGEICREELRKVDIFGRIGGEEFAVLLPTADAAAAGQTAERLRLSIASADWAKVAGLSRVTASFGVAGVHLPDESLGESLARADRALYEAKHSGRDRVCSAQPHVA